MQLTEQSREITCTLFGIVADSVCLVGLFDKVLAGLDSFGILLSTGNHLPNVLLIEAR